MILGENKEEFLKKKVILRSNVVKYTLTTWWSKRSINFEIKYILKYETKIFLDIITI